MLSPALPMPWKTAGPSGFPKPKIWARDPSGIGKPIWKTLDLDQDTTVLVDVWPMFAMWICPMEYDGIWRNGFANFGSILHAYPSFWEK